MRRVFSTSLLRCVGAAGVSSAVLYGPQFRFQSQAPPGVPPSTRAPPQQQRRDGGRPAGGPDADHQHSHDAEADFEPPQKPTEVPKFVKIHTNEKGVTNVQLARGPVNSLSLEYLQELNQWLLWLGSNDETKAVIVSSAIPTVFSAGLDLTEVHNPKPERLAEFWHNEQELWLILNSFPKPIIAAITGNSPAGGCIIAMGCDYRVMARGPKDSASNNRLYRIGLNEAKLGLVAPPWAMPAYSYLLGSRKAELMLQLGETPTADEAQKLGLVDEVVVDEEKAVEAAYQQAERFLAVPQQARWMARDMMRREYLQMLATDEERSYDRDFIVQFFQNPEVQKNLGDYMERLRSRSRK
ncbi:putative mitochondrial 3,2-trans-enoyl-CoA isomerase, mitochondrial precursor [Leptomonas pyrrhocoris]|uniref:Enoyl-CoA delta isomerase 1, mitochondrial n=1 Tax=Leptomonas pyrrhocoris TaxID=157538 RepID=A0A0M9FYI2_LEPPY|nr:putative mitochondrial 3,2-trans-enoyl-CoA isomerase, mitochondrial precursor [Leptomonas pyrrhocoris]KPA78705.1 putative mitochondrial 3,2-trans-enoyl-CoA isomerase, mitochondrial precursor [Leptomonas pyrrhocoris]|eukprot:XP_015657144.1 putative mitochondrial 3,2-trans-enoyl-CoA isomerase, mitochondrial precursor [Leptomonas pyrrhocoris]